MFAAAATSTPSLVQRRQITVRSLFLRIFLSLSAALILITFAVTLAAVGSGTVPLTLPILARAFLSDEITASAGNALAAYHSGGTALLSRYFNQLEGTNGTYAWLLGPDGKDVLGRAIPNSASRIAQRPSEFAIPAVELRRFELTAAVKLENGGQPVTVVFARRIARSPRPRILFPNVGLRYLAGLLAAIAFSYVLSKLLAAPVKALRQCMSQYSGGTVTLTLPPKLLARKDELGDLAREFDQMKQRIEGLLRRQQQLLADISHELRSPLTRLAVAIEITRESTEREPELLERMSREVSYLESLIQQLLRLAALENQSVGGNNHPTSLTDVLAVAVENAEFEANAAHKTVLYDRPAKDLLVHGDEVLLASTLENILRNAVRYTPANTGVEVDVASLLDSKTISVTIRDHGPGVPTDALPDIFRPFYRVGTARDRECGGVGLGLSIAQRSIMVCGGSIAARNHEDGGLVVEVRLKRVS
jgi:two-component system sensor histidine kinase CpxA